MVTLPRVLFVDDVVLVTALRRLLQSKFSFVHSSTPAEGMALLDVDDDFDGIVLKVDNAAARTVYEGVLVDPAVARRVVFVTSASDPASKEFLARAARPWLIKPFVTEDLERELVSVTSSRHRRG